MSLIVDSLCGTFNSSGSLAQTSFPYTLELVPVEIAGLPGVHSYAWAQHEGKWLVAGGRKDGMHARQPFNAFPAQENNTEIYVIDPLSKEFWSSEFAERAYICSHSISSLFRA